MSLNTNSAFWVRKRKKLFPSGTHQKSVRCAKIKTQNRNGNSIAHFVGKCVALMLLYTNFPQLECTIRDDQLNNWLRSHALNKFDESFVRIAFGI